MNLLVLTVYLIIVALTFSKAVESLESQVVIEGNSNFLDEQLEEQELKELLEIKFKLPPSYQISDFKHLAFNLKNKSENSSIDIDWDRSSIRDFEGGGRRAIRVLDDDQEVPQKQVATILVPGESRDIKVSDEKFNDPLFDSKKLNKMIDKSEGFRLVLSIKVFKPDGKATTDSLSLQFTPKKLLWTKALYLDLQPK